ncbi:uncharacterized protein LOC136029568 [Artemia franciscana]|uniref:uncharacterized protein LOC136029568 n=1 Tax=Artemia franciscana TaxID=6661 RepID=UPI0032DB94B7
MKAIISLLSLYFVFHLSLQKASEFSNEELRRRDEQCKDKEETKSLNELFQPIGMLRFRPFQNLKRKTTRKKNCPASTEVEPAQLPTMESTEETGEVSTEEASTIASVVGPSLSLGRPTTPSPMSPSTTEPSTKPYIIPMMLLIPPNYLSEGVSLCCSPCQQKPDSQPSKIPLSSKIRSSEIPNYFYQKRIPTPRTKQQRHWPT